ncbi:branched-chain amino acid ABC transporter [Malaciobacter molluscorum LMG 25693]|uniref:Branched-chain amino acid ABC transporter n=1 Tax=Malaciobacter molluscorum LMG 25693 TaxID=870501 RepID=A0A2G1DH08_9BACT|nr:AzlD domain-containing protein [Malaciobacter molluscorum]AXX93366.1 branched-chain amino acid transport protein, AzlD family [Malaciobacter molluscorum LMG 25693]PHO17771.1 branched-chain amino acid ABC transporter [Malaciobacter molluscorum LMG 25693]RXJ95119.1 branched-chain amino acid ABC transporter [Malaciobacter molluscorum]
MSGSVSIDIYIAILIMVLVNYFTRVFPFIFFIKKEPPEYIVFIERFFPAIIIVILIVYTLREIDFSLYPYGLKEIFGVFFTAILHISIKNYLISIFGGTIFYMALVQYL